MKFLWEGGQSEISKAFWFFFGFLWIVVLITAF